MDIISRFAVALTAVFSVSAANAATLDLSSVGAGFTTSPLSLSNAMIISPSTPQLVIYNRLGSSTLFICGFSAGCPHDMRIDFTRTVSNLSFDVDGFDAGDAVRVDALDGSGQVLQSITISPSTTSYAFGALGGIASVLFDDSSSVGSNGAGYGNFSFTQAAIPLPPSALMMFSVLGAAAVYQRRALRRR